MQIKNVSKLLKRMLGEGNLLPQRFKVTDKDQSWFMYLDLNDQRGRSIGINGMTQLHLLSLWNSLEEQICPDTVIDVGVNYGEFLFSKYWEKPTTIIGIEGSKKIFKHITKTHLNHPNKDKIALHNVLAGNENTNKEFWINQNWSGVSSIAKPEKDKDKYIKEVTPMKRIDSLVSSSESLLFKIDVEGYEAGVVDGMETLLNSAKSFAGLIEYNFENISSCGYDPNKFIQKLLSYGPIFLIQREKNNSKTILKNIDSSSSLNELAGDGKYDIIATKNFKLQKP